MSDTNSSMKEGGRNGHDAEGVHTAPEVLRLGHKMNLVEIGCRSSVRSTQWQPVSKSCVGGIAD